MSRDCGLGMIKRGEQKSKEDVTEADEAFKAGVRLDRIHAYGPTGYRRKRAHVFCARRARQPVWSGLDVGGWMNARLLYSI